MCYSVEPIGVGKTRIHLVQRSFLLVSKFNRIFEGVRKMEEIIIVAGKSKSDVYSLRRCLREKDYNSISCNSAEKIIEEIEILPTCDATVSLVIMEPEILRDISNDVIAKLTDIALDVPFLLANKQEAQSDLVEIFDNICEYRIAFKEEQNPELAEVFREIGVEVACS